MRLSGGSCATQVALLFRSTSLVEVNSAAKEKEKRPGTDRFSQNWVVKLFSVPDAVHRPRGVDPRRSRRHPVDAVRAGAPH